MQFARSQKARGPWPIYAFASKRFTTWVPSLGVNKAAQEEEKTELLRKPHWPPHGALENAEKPRGLSKTPEPSGMTGRLLWSSRLHWKQERAVTETIGFCGKAQRPETLILRHAKCRAIAYTASRPV